MATEQMTAQVVVEVDKWSVKAAEQELSRLKSPTGINFAANLAELRKQLQVVNGQIKAAQKSWDLTAELQFRTNAESLKKQITIANRELVNFTRTWSTETSALWQLFDNLGKKIWGTTWSIVSNLWKATWSMTSFLGAALTWAGIVWLWAGLTSLGIKAIQLWDRLEQAQISFEVMLWSAEKATNLLKDLAEFAKRTPFELLQIRDVTKQLLAFGIAEENIIWTLKVLGDIAAGTGTGIDRIAYAFGQVRAAGRLTGNELRQFTEAWVPLLWELAKMYWVTEWAAREMISDGLVWFNDVQQAFVNMTSEWGKFHDLMIKQSTTLSWKISNLKDSFNQLLEEWGGWLTPFAKKFIDVLAFTLDWFNEFTIKLWWGFKLLQNWAAALANVFVISFQALSAAVRMTWNDFVWFAKDFITNAKIIAWNIWIAFKNIPVRIWEAMNMWLQKLEEFLNKASSGVSNFAKKFWLDLWLWQVTLWRINTWGWQEPYKDLVNSNQKIADERNRAIQEDFNAKKEMFVKIAQLWALDLDRTINEANAKLSTYRKLNYELKKIAEAAAKDGAKSWASWAAEEKRLAKEKEELQKDALKNTKDILEEEIKAQKEALKETEKTIESIKDAIEEFSKLNDKIADIGKDAQDKIASRFNTIGEKIQDTKEKLSEFTDAEKQYANAVWLEALTNMAWDTELLFWWKWIKVSELREYLKLQKELADLEAEKALALANTTPEAIAADNLSETQKIINEATARKLDLEQEKLDIEAKIGLKEEEAAAQLAILEQSKLDQEAIITTYSDVVKNIEEQITSITKKNTEERLALYEIEMNKIRALIALRNSAQVGWGWWVSNVTNTVNNNPNLNINANINTPVDLDVFSENLAKKVVLSSKWINT